MAYSVPVADYKHIDISPKNGASPRIRIMHLLPGAGSDPLRCHLKIVRLQKAGKYEALSYVWGNELSPQSLLCEGGGLTITVNLDRALRGLRDPKHTRKLWVDAVCIDQNNLEERSQQVAFMQSIYANASRVVVWLGPKNPKMVEGLASVAKWAGVLRDVFRTVKNSNKKQASDTEFLIELFSLFAATFEEPATVEDYRSLKWVSELGYFKRIWCLQEVAYSQSCIGKSDDLEIDFSDVLSLGFYLPDHDVLKGSSDSGRGDHLSVWDRISTTAGGTGVKIPFMFLWLLRRVGLFESTDPKDRVYAILSICDLDMASTKEASTTSPVRKNRHNMTLRSAKSPRFCNMDNLLKPDYGKSVQHVYRDCVRFLLMKHQPDLMILAYIDHEDDLQRDGFATWVPRFDEILKFDYLSTNIFNAGYPIMDSDESLDLLDALTLREIADPDIIVLNGFRVDTVDVVSDVIKELDNWDTLSGLWKQVFGSELFSKAFEEYSKESANNIITTSPQIHETVNEAFLQTFGVGLEGVAGYFRLKGVLSYGDLEATIPELRTAAAMAWYNWLKQNCPKTMTEEELVQLFPKFAAASSQSCTLASEAESLREPSIDEYMNERCLGRCIYRTSTGLLGLGPKATKRGDVVAVMFGSRDACTLRKLEGRHWAYVGNSYLHHEALMMGQEARTILESHTERIETFALS